MPQKYKAHQTYTVKVLGSERNKVIFFFCPFGASIRQFSLPGMPIWYLVRRNYQVIAYCYNNSIATKTVKFTIDSLETILNDATNRLTKIKKETEISCFGSSMGTVLAVNFAARHS